MNSVNQIGFVFPLLTLTNGLPLYILSKDQLNSKQTYGEVAPKNFLAQSKHENSLHFSVKVSWNCVCWFNKPLSHTYPFSPPISWTTTAQRLNKKNKLSRNSCAFSQALIAALYVITSNKLVLSVMEDLFSPRSTRKMFGVDSIQAFIIYNLRGLVDIVSKPKLMLSEHSDSLIVGKCMM